MRSDLDKATRSRWLNWHPGDEMLRRTPESGPTKPTKPGFVGFVGSTSEESAENRGPDEALKGQAVELYLSNGDCLFIVADEEDALKLGEPRGAIYTKREADCIIQIRDPNIVAEVHRWKRMFDARIRQWHDRQNGSVGVFGRE